MAMTGHDERPLTATQPRAPPGFLSVRDIHAYYGESYIVQGVSFDMHEGDIVALLGRNGAGKTSTLRTLARAGARSWARRDLAGRPAVHKLHDFQAARAGYPARAGGPAHHPGLTVEENLLWRRSPLPMGWSLDRIYARSRASPSGASRRA